MLKAYWPCQLPTPGFYFRGVADTRGWPFEPPTSSATSLYTYLDGARNVGRYGRERPITDLQLNSLYTRHPLERPKWPYVFCISELTLDASQSENPIPIPIHIHLLPGSLQTTGPALGRNVVTAPVFSVCRRCHCRRNRRSTWMAQTQTAKVPSFPGQMITNHNNPQRSGPGPAL